MLKLDTQIISARRRPSRSANMPMPIAPNAMPSAPALNKGPSATRSILHSRSSAGAR